MSILLFSSNIGVLIGYVTTAQMMRILTWKWSFYIQILSTVPLWIILAVTPKSYLDLDGVYEEQLMEQSSKSGSPATSSKFSNNNNNDMATAIARMSISGGNADALTHRSRSNR